MPGLSFYLRRHVDKVTPLPSVIKGERRQSHQLFGMRSKEIPNASRDHPEGGAGWRYDAENWQQGVFVAFIHPEE